MARRSITRFDPIKVEGLLHTDETAVGIAEGFRQWQTDECGFSEFDSLANDPREHGESRLGYSRATCKICGERLLHRKGLCTHCEPVELPTVPEPRGALVARNEKRERASQIRAENMNRRAQEAIKRAAEKEREEKLRELEDAEAREFIRRSKEEQRKNEKLAWFVFGLLGVQIPERKK